MTSEPFAQVMAMLPGAMNEASLRLSQAFPAGRQSWWSAWRHLHRPAVAGLPVSGSWLTFKLAIGSANALCINFPRTSDVACQQGMITKRVDHSRAAPGISMNRANGCRQENQTGIGIRNRQTVADILGDLSVAERL